MKNKTKLFAIGLISTTALIHVACKIKKYRSNKMIILSDENCEIDDELKFLLSKGKKIKAIKKAKKALGLNLIDAKRYVAQLA